MALKQAEQVEFARGVHLIEHLVGRKIVDADDHALAQIAKALRQTIELPRAPWLPFRQARGAFATVHITAF